MAKEWEEDVSPGVLFDQHYRGEADETFALHDTTPIRGRRKGAVDGWSSQRRIRYEIKRSNGDLTLTDWKNIVSAFGERCAYCGLIGDEDTLVIEHVVPVAQGGRTDVNNVVPSCPECNTLKAARDLLQWFDEEQWGRFAATYRAAFARFYRGEA